jgi:uncharacterized Rmd1/YagE family protein
MNRYSLSAHYIKISLNLAKIEQKNSDLPLFQLLRKERNLLVYQAGDNRFVCVYSFGVVVIVGIDDKKEISKLLRKFAYGREEEPGAEGDPQVPPEEYAITVDPDQPEAVEFDFTRLKQLSFEKMLLVCHVAAQSVAIDHLDTRVHRALGLFEATHSQMEKRGTLGMRTKAAVRMLGDTGNTVHFIVGRLALLDKPDITWEDKEAESLFVGLRKMFELDDRFSALRFKLDFIQSSTVTVLEVMQAKRAEMLEIIIIALITAEILMAIAGLM